MEKMGEYIDDLSLMLTLSIFWENGMMKWRPVSTDFW
jgi:hypothetical protein